MKTHTPKPWFAVKNSADSWDVSVKDSIYAQCVAGVYRTRYIDGDQEANARLIAAAPDLLEALEDMTARFERCCKYNQSADDEMLSEATNQAYTAIAKARGKL